MVAQATQRQSTFSGLRPINSSRDVAHAADLVEQAFAQDMDSYGRSVMREMRWLSTLFGWADFLNPPGQGIMPGFVWVEDDRIVGNVTVRRLSLFGRGWMIGNVAVDAAWRKRGIARNLMNAAIDLAREQQAEWIALQVRSDNTIARGLYRSLDFEDVGETIYFERTQFDRAPLPSQPIEGHLRPARADDFDRIFTLAQSLVPDTARWAEPMYRSSFDHSLERRFTNWLTGTQAVWRVIQVGDQLWGAAMAEAKRWSRRGQLHVWVVPQRTGRIEQILIDSVLAAIDVPLQSMTARVSGQHVAARVALTTRGFQQTRALTHMKLTLNEK
jgi:ribosomal protein S18 acetylase RimI-like enzyme